MNNQTKTLNPFAFDAETSGRYALLVVTCVGLIFVLGVTTLMRLTGEDVLSTITANADQVLQGPSSIQGQGILPPKDVLQQYIASVLPIVQQAIFGMMWQLFLPAVALIVVPLLLAFLVYRRHPHAIKRRIPYTTLEPEHIPDVAAFVEEVSAEHDLPQIEIVGVQNDGFRLADGKAFGLSRRPILMIGGHQPLYINLAWRKQVDRFKALCLHEISHIVNGDVAYNQVAEAIWVDICAICGCDSAF